jgi:tetratricopeptide (TPR) repeat protein
VNRERLLFVGVIAIVALWYLVLREDAKISGVPSTGTEKVSVLPTGGSDRPRVLLRMPAPYGAFTQVTNEREHERPPLPIVAARDLPNIRIPTSRSVRRSLLGRLRHGTVAPIEGAATIELPAAATDGAEKAVQAQIDREDGFNALGNPRAGRVLRIKYKGEVLRDPGELPMPGPLPEKNFYYLLALCETNPGEAEKLGVTHLEVELKIGGSSRINYPFPGEIKNIQVAVSGKEKPYWEGLKTYLRLPKKGIAPRVDKGQKLLQAGVQAGSFDPRIRWALIILEEARQMVPKQARAQLKDILVLELDAANRLFEYERVLELAFEHLSLHPGEADVLETVGTLLASRSFGLMEQAEQWFAKASQSQSAQLKRVEVLIRLDRFDDARRLLESGRAGAGAGVNLLLARTALAQGDYATATQKATPYAAAAGEHAAEGNLILGGVAYAQGDGAKAEEHFMAAVEADPTRSEAYSDLGLALIAQGKMADAEVCFARAEQLDFENTVIPGLGRAYAKFAAADAALVLQAVKLEESTKRKNNADILKEAAAAAEAAQTAIAEADALLRGENGLEENNPRDLLVRYFVGYALERAGSLEQGGLKYRSVIDNDHRYRIAIARLGVVVARLIDSSRPARRSPPRSRRRKSGPRPPTRTSRRRSA